MVDWGADPARSGADPAPMAHDSAGWRRCGSGAGARGELEIARIRRGSTSLTREMGPGRVQTGPGAGDIDGADAGQGRGEEAAAAT